MKPRKVFVASPGRRGKLIDAWECLRCGSIVWDRDDGCITCPLITPDPEGTDNEP